MNRHESPPAGSRPRPMLWALSSSNPRPAGGPGERVLVSSEGFRLTSERLEVEGRSWRLEELRGFGTRHAAPNPRLPLLCGVGAALVVPMLMLQPHSVRVTAALVAATLVVFASIARLVAAADTYWLTVRTAEGERLVLRCQDHQLFARVVEALGEELEGPGPRAPAPAPVHRLALVR